MSFRDLNIKKSYSSDNDNVLFDFYIPVLKQSKKYDRLAGFFTSSALAVAAKGIVNFIYNNGHMRLIASPRLSENDTKEIINSKLNPELYITDLFNMELEKMENSFIEDHVKALGWMIANKKLEIKIAIVFDDNGNIMDSKSIEEKGIFHQKIGILYDEQDDVISFSGSINESGTAWVNNIEEFKVFKSWHLLESEYLTPDLYKFERIWNSLAKRIRVVSLPKAVEQKLIDISPPIIESIDWKKYYQKKENKKLNLFEHQKQAVDKWVQNGNKGMLVMATGTGKTITALGCLQHVISTYQKWVTIIACPQNHLSQQWLKEIDRYGINYQELIVADGTNKKWKPKLVEYLLDIYLGNKKNLLVLTTHRTLSSKDFIKILYENKRATSAFLIADEVHGLGASESRKGLLDIYDLRLGLSATPERWFDEEGTNEIFRYFNKVVYEFEINKALHTINPITGKTYLTPYKYIPKFISLNEEELEDYITKTRSIVKKTYSKKDDEDKSLSTLYFLRANIIKNVEEKRTKFFEIIKELKPAIKSTIVFCSPQQIEIVMEILISEKVIAHRFTENEGTKPEKKYSGLSQREYLLDKFSEGDYQVLVALKCLDEGVDVPNAKVAILLSSSTNPREYIQRIGRVIRRAPGKEEAIIYDLIVVPSLSKMPAELREIEWKIFNKELNRSEEIAKNAINNADALKELNNIKYKLLE